MATDQAKQQAEEDLRALILRYSAILASVPDIIMEVNENHIYTWANDAGRRFFGDDVIGKSADDYFEGDQETYQQVEPLFEGSEDVIYIESWQRRRDGERCLLAWWCKTLKDGTGNVKGALSTARDITDRWRLGQTQATLLSLIEYAVSHSVQEILQRFLDEAERLTKSEVGLYHFLEEGEVVIQAWSSNTRKRCPVAGLERRDAVEEGAWADCLRERRPIVQNDYANLDRKYDLPDGPVPLVRELVVPVVSGDQVLAILGVGNKATNYDDHDIQMVQKLADAACETVVRKRMEEALHNEQAFTETALNAQQDTFFLFESATGRAVKWNRVFRQVSGFSDEEIAELPAPATYYSPADLERAESFMAKVVEEGTGVIELDLICKDGRKVPTEYQVALIKDQQGEPRYIVSIGRDISDRIRSEREKEKLAEQLRQAQKMEAIGQLAGGVAHDFNNLITVINSYAGFAADELFEGDPLKADIQQIQDAGTRAASLTRQLLAFSRKQVMEPKVLSLGDIVENLEKMLRRLIGEDIDIVINLAEDLGRVSADAGQIEQVLMNLVVNARDAMPNGGKLSIATQNEKLDEMYTSIHSETAPGNYVMLAVSDTGLGMKEEVKERIFEPFYTTKEKSKGTGLGLSTVYGIIKQSGGTIWVYSEPNQGTTFKVYLPRIETAKIEPVRETQDLLEGTETVLVVEDERVVRKLTVRILQNAGYTVIAAANGGEAMLLCEQSEHPIDLVLTDVVMPNMSGKELMERLEQIRPGMKVIFMSGYTDDYLGIIQEGTHFIAKPFNKTELLTKVRCALRDQ